MGKGNVRYTILSVLVAVVALCYVATSDKTKELIGMFNGSETEEVLLSIEEGEPISDETSIFLKTALDFSEVSMFAKDKSQEYGDEFSSYFMENHEEFLELDEMFFGYFGGSEREELMAIFTVVNTCHAEGFDKKIVAIYDLETGELLLEKSFGTDGTDIYILDSDTIDHSLLLMTGYFLYTGVVSGRIEMGSLENDTWSPIDLPKQEDGKAYAYAYYEETETLKRTEVITGGLDSLPSWGEEVYFEWNWDTMEFVELA